MVVSENSASTGARKTVSIVQQNASALGATALDIVSGGGKKGIFLDKNYTSTAAATGSDAVRGIELDLDQSSSGPAQIDVFGVDINSAASGGGGTGTNVGLRSTVSGTATQYAALFSGGNTGFGTSTPDSMVDVESGTSTQLRLGFSGTVATTFQSIANGQMDVVGTGSVKIKRSSGTTSDELLTVANSSANIITVENQGAILFGDHPSAPTDTANRLYANTTGLFYENSALSTVGATIGKSIAITIVFG